MTRQNPNHNPIACENKNLTYHKIDALPSPKNKKLLFGDAGRFRSTRDAGRGTLQIDAGRGTLQIDAGRGTLQIDAGRGKTQKGLLPSPEEIRNSPFRLI